MCRILSIDFNYFLTIFIYRPLLGFLFDIPIYFAKLVVFFHAIFMNKLYKIFHIFQYSSKKIDISNITGPYHVMTMSILLIVQAHLLKKPVKIAQLYSFPGQEDDSEWNISLSFSNSTFLMSECKYL